MRKELAAVVGLLLPLSANAQAPSVEDRVLQSHAAEAVIWAMPAVNADMMLQAALKAGAKENEIVYWSRPVDWHNQTLTPNPDAIYLMPFFNTKDGPVVIDVPPASSEGSFTANIDDIWQMPLEDAGPSGADKGVGGKYLLLPPGYKGAFRRGISCCPCAPIAAMPCSGPRCKATRTPTWQSPSHTARSSRSIP